MERGGGTRETVSLIDGLQPSNTDDGEGELVVNESGEVLSTEGSRIHIGLVDENDNLCGISDGPNK